MVSLNANPVHVMIWAVKTPIVMLTMVTVIATQMLLETNVMNVLTSFMDFLPVMLVIVMLLELKKIPLVMRLEFVHAKMGILEKNVINVLLDFSIKMGFVQVSLSKVLQLR